jgi:predicted nucleic acid-binding protein
MKVIVDTVIWSLAFRRQAAHANYRNALTDLIADGRVELLASVRQKVLSGIRHQEQFERLKLALRAFPDMVLDTQDYECAADFFNQCQKQGIQGANTDFLICAAAVNHNCQIFTTDKDFHHFATIMPLKLYHYES